MERYLANSNSRRGSAQPYHPPQPPLPVMAKPCIVGFMSVDVHREYHSDLSQLKFITAIPRGKLSWDLNHNIDKAVKRTTEDNVEKIDLLLKFILDQGKRFKFPQNTFITYRRTLIAIMYSAFNLTEPICIRATLFKNNIYLTKMQSQKDVDREKSMSKQEKNFCAWGYKFEQYMTSDHPAMPPNIDRPVIENEEFSLCYCSQIGDHKLFYAAQIDGLLATGGSEPSPPETTDVQENINYLKNRHYVELKTNKELQHPKQERNLKRYKMLTCWCQCYLANLKGLLVGFRSDHGIIGRLQWFDTAQIADYCKHEWDPQTTLNFLDYFLTFVKKSFIYNNDKENCLKEPLTLDFFINVNRQIDVSQLNEPEEALLPDWYIQAQNII